MVVPYVVLMRYLSLILSSVYVPILWYVMAICIFFIVPVFVGYPPPLTQLLFPGSIVYCWSGGPLMLAGFVAPLPLLVVA